MTDREAFEAWAGKREKAPTTSAWDYAFKAWQAATAAERERCANMLDEAAKDYREIGDAHSAEQTEFLAEYLRA